MKSDQSGGILAMRNAERGFPDAGLVAREWPQIARGALLRCGDLTGRPLPGHWRTTTSQPRGLKPAARGAVRKLIHSTGSIETVRLLLTNWSR